MYFEVLLAAASQMHSNRVRTDLFVWWVNSLCRSRNSPGDREQRMISGSDSSAGCEGPATSSSVTMQTDLLFDFFFSTGATATGSGCSGSVTVCVEMLMMLLVSSSSLTVCVDMDAVVWHLVSSSSVTVCIDTGAALLFVSSSLTVCGDMDAVVWHLVLSSSVAFCADMDTVAWLLLSSSSRKRCTTPCRALFLSMLKAVQGRQSGTNNNTLLSLASRDNSTFSKTAVSSLKDWKKEFFSPPSRGWV